MPWLPALAAIAGLAGTGVSIGESIANSGGGAPSPTAPTTPQGPKPPDANALLQQKALVSNQLPNVVGATSGLASPSYDSLIAQILAGTIGQPGSAAAGASATDQQFQPANSQPTNSVVNGQQPNLSDFLSGFSG